MNRDLILKKLTQLASYVEELQHEIFSRTEEEVKNEPTLLHTAERLVQLAVDTMVAINIHLLTSREKHTMKPNLPLFY